MAIYTLAVAKYTYKTSEDAAEMMALRALGFTFDQAITFTYELDDENLGAESPAVQSNIQTLIPGEYTINGRVSVDVAGPGLAPTMPTVDISTLSDMQALVRSLGRLVVDADHITIYNGYLE